MELSKARVVMLLLAFIGIPTTGYGLYVKYLKEASVTVVSGAEAIDLYKQCMLLRAKTTPQRPQQAKAFLADMERKLSETVSAASRLAALDKGPSSTIIATELPKCVADLKKEISES